MKEAQIHQMPLRIPASLHQALKEASRLEGVSLNQYCLYLLAKNVNDSEKWMTHRGEELLKFFQESHHLQKEFNKHRKTSFKEEPVRETPLKRWKKIYGSS